MSDKNVTFIKDGVLRKLEELEGLLELLMVEKGLAEVDCQLVAVKNAFRQLDSTVGSITVQDTWPHEAAAHLRLAADMTLHFGFKDRLDSDEDNLTGNASLILKATIPEPDELLIASQSGLLHDVDQIGREEAGIDAVARLFSFSIEEEGAEKPAGFGDLEDDQIVEVTATLNELLESQTVLEDFISQVAEKTGDMMRKKAAEICV